MVSRMRIHGRSLPTVGALGVVVAAAAVLTSSAVAATPSPAGCKAPKKFHAPQYAAEVADTYVTYCEVCFDIGPKAIRMDYKLTATEPKKIATIYAKRDEQGFNRLAGTQGCIRGFALRRKP
jgi:hypothetical protein